MGTYNLYVKTNGHWQWVCSIVAENHPDAFRQAMTKLKPEHYSKQIRLEQELIPPQLGLSDIIDERQRI
jgi:hypothetical protein